MWSGGRTVGVSPCTRARRMNRVPDFMKRVGCEQRYLRRSRPSEYRCHGPISRHFARWAGVARSKRGNHASGAETRRPSTSVTISSSSLKVTPTASAMGLLVKVLIPRHDKTARGARP